MTVQELIDELSKLPRNLPVILSSDAGGNSYMHARNIDQSPCRNPDAYHPEVLHPDDLAEMGEDERKGIGEAVVLWP